MRPRIWTPAAAQLFNKAVNRERERSGGRITWANIVAAINRDGFKFTVEQCRKRLYNTKRVRQARVTRTAHSNGAAPMPPIALAFCSHCGCNLSAVVAPVLNFCPQCGGNLVAIRQALKAAQVIAERIRARA
jgi:hypothetical protein